MSFAVFLLVLAFGTLFVGVSIQIRHMAIELKAPWGHVPNILARKLSDAAYEWACGVIGWSLVILGALTYNTATVKPGGAFWCAVYFGALVVLYSLLWLRNRHEDLKP